MIVIEVKSGDAHTFTAKSGKQYRTQEAYAHTARADGTPHAYPSRFEFFLERDQAPYAPGVYTLAPASLYVDRGGRLAVAPKFIPAKR